MSFTVVTKVPLPAHVAPEAAIAAIQAYRPLIEANPHLVSYERRSVGVEEVIDDPFFRDDGQRLQAFTVYQRITIIPGVGSWATKDVAVPCVFQSVQYGCRCRADASGGVTVRSRYEIRRRGEVPDGADKPGPPPGPGDGDYELVEIAEVACGTFVKPFVRHSLSTSHQEILQRVADEVVRNYEAQRPESAYERSRPSAPPNYGAQRPATTYEMQMQYATQEDGPPRPSSNHGPPRPSSTSEAQSQYSVPAYGTQPPTQTYTVQQQYQQEYQKQRQQQQQQQQQQAPPIAQPPGNFI